MSWKRCVNYVKWLDSTSAVARLEGWAWSPVEDLLDLVRRTLEAAHLKDGDSGPHPESPAGKYRAEADKRKRAEREIATAGFTGRVAADRARTERIAALNAAVQAQEVTGGDDRLRGVAGYSVDEGRPV